MNQESTQATPLPDHRGKEAAEQKEQRHAKAMDDVVDFHERRPSVIHRGPDGDAGVGQSGVQHNAQQHGPGPQGVKIVAAFVHSESLPFWGAHPSGSCRGLVGQQPAQNRSGFHLDFRRLRVVREPIHPC